GPSGGDGGNGGDVVLLTDDRLTTLLDFRFKREYRARNGEPGRGRDQNGHAAVELLLKIPPGTVVKDAGTGEVLADLRENARRWVLAKGGRGGLGNMNFATSTLQAPRFAQPGTEGEEKRVKLELGLFDPAVRRKTQVVAANKIDVPEARERAQELAKKLKRRKIPVHLVSGATGEGLPELLDAMVRALDGAGIPQPLERDLHPR